MSEQIGVILIFAGLALVCTGVVMTALRAVGILVGRAAPRRLLRPLALIGTGLVLGATPLVWQNAYLAIIGLGPREKLVDGSRAIVLTGWDRDDYSFLAEQADLEIVEMANADVTDASLAVLTELPRLRELTLNDTAISDVGLASLASLPNLETLRVARTAVTAEGVERFLASPPPRLRQIDVSGNGIPTAILRVWKNAASPGEERRYVD